MKSLVSSLKEYLEVRRALGYQLKETERTLKKFILFLQQPNQNHITAKLALEWAMLPQNVQRSHWSKRLSMVRLFAQYRQYEDPRTEIPPPHILSQQPCRAIPYIYSDDEIYRLLVACQSLISRGLRHHTYFTFFGLLAVTGCRVSELIALDRNNFDDQQGWIAIRNSKFEKSRLLPLHQTTRLQLEKYGKFRDQFHSKRESDAFFVSDQGKRLTVWSVRWAFINLSKTIGLRAQSDTHGPRVHDLRHTFAVKSLLKWYREGANIDQKITLLSTYLGHKKPSDTYWYLTGVPELLAEATTRLEKQIGE
jgi:integrase/recombinase XerD